MKELRDLQDLTTHDVQPKATKGACRCLFGLTKFGLTNFVTPNRLRQISQRDLVNDGVVPQTSNTKVKIVLEP